MVFRADLDQHPGVAVHGEHVFHAHRDDWIQFAYDLLRVLDPIDLKDAPVMLRRIAEALDQDSE